MAKPLALSLMYSLPDQFLQKFVRKTMRKRVAHEWQKKPEKLHARICHQAGELFESKFKSQTVEFTSKEECLVLSGSQIKILQFSEIKDFLGVGDGILIVSIDGSRFIAETETVKGRPHEIYSGS